MPTAPTRPPHWGCSWSLAAGTVAAFVAAEGGYRSESGRPLNVSGEGGGPERHEPRDEALAGYRDGDIVSFGSRKLPDEGRGKPLTVRWEVEVATGKPGEMVALAQTAAIWDMLAWLAARKSAEEAAERGDGESPPAPSDE